MAADSALRLPENATIEYVQMHTHASRCSGSLVTAVKRVMCSSGMSQKNLNCLRHCSSTASAMKPGKIRCPSSLKLSTCAALSAPGFSFIVSFN